MVMGKNFRDLVAGVREQLFQDVANPRMQLLSTPLEEALISGVLD
jgi:hypothetical protein